MPIGPFQAHLLARSEDGPACRRGPTNLDPRGASYGLTAGAWSALISI